MRGISVYIYLPIHIYIYTDIYIYIYIQSLDNPNPFDSNGELKALSPLVHLAALFGDIPTIQHSTESAFVSGQSMCEGVSHACVLQAHLNLKKCIVQQATAAFSRVLASCCV